MTREEASIIIGNIPVYGDECYSIAEYQEAKAMAIKALEQEPCEIVLSPVKPYKVNLDLSNLPQMEKSLIDNEIERQYKLRAAKLRAEREKK